MSEVFLLSKCSFLIFHIIGIFLFTSGKISTWNLFTLVWKNKKQKKSPRIKKMKNKIQIEPHWVTKKKTNGKKRLILLAWQLWATLDVPLISGFNWRDNLLTWHMFTNLNELKSHTCFWEYIHFEWIDRVHRFDGLSWNFCDSFLSEKSK